MGNTQDIMEPCTASNSKADNVSAISTFQAANEICDKILKGKNYYDILMISKESDITTIKKQYKKLALTVHPDKCPISQAAEAFSMISKAFQCLSDPHKREEYNKAFGEYDYSKDEARMSVLIIFIPFFLMILTAWVIHLAKTNRLNW